MTNDDIKELVDLALAIDAAGENDDAKELERLDAAFDEAWMGLAKREIAQGRERPTRDDFFKLMSAYDEAAAPGGTAQHD